MRRSWIALGKSLLLIAGILWVSGFGAVIASHEHDHHGSEQTHDHAPFEHEHGGGCAVCVAAAAMLGAQWPTPVAIVVGDRLRIDVAEVPESLPRGDDDRRRSARDPPPFGSNLT